MGPGKGEQPVLRLSADTKLLDASGGLLLLARRDEMDVGHMLVTASLQRGADMDTPTADRSHSARVSMPGQAASGLGIKAQHERCAAYAVAMNYVPVEQVTDAGVSGSVPRGPRESLAGSR